MGEQKVTTNLLKVFVMLKVGLFGQRYLVMTLPRVMSSMFQQKFSVKTNPNNGPILLVLEHCMILMQEKSFSLVLLQNVHVNLLQPQPPPQVTLLYSPLDFHFWPFWLHFGSDLFKLNTHFYKYKTFLYLKK